MLDYQRISDELRSSLHASGPKAVEIVLAASTAYISACQEIDERLRRCGELLKMGLRSEALQQCELEPNLLDAVALLDFPERELWIKRVAGQGIVIPGPLQIDIASELNEAYAAEQPLKGLLATHRWLALAKAPLRARIATLRELAESDPGNPVWLEDLQTFEGERLRQIERETSNSLEAEDSGAISALAEELRNTPWTELPPASFLERIGQAQATLAARQRLCQLQQLESEITAAFSAMDLGTLRLLRERWSANFQASGLTGDEPICERIAPALQWLDYQSAKEQQQQQFSKALLAFEHSLDQPDPTVASLENAYREATSYGQPLPLTIEERFQSRIQTFRQTARQRWRRRMTFASVVLLGGTCLVGTAAMRHWRHSELASQAAALTRLLDESKLTEAQRYLEQLKIDFPTSLVHPELSSLAASLDTLLQQEAARERQFEELVAQTKHAVAAIVDWPTQHYAKQLLSEAQALATTDAQQGEIRNLVLELAPPTSKLQQQVDVTFQSALDPLSRGVRQIEEQPGVSLPDQQSAILQLRSDLGLLDLRSAQVTPALRSQIKSLFARIDALEEKASVEQQKQQALARITRSVGARAKFKQALAEYAGAFSQSERAADFRDAGEESALWECLAEYSTLTSRWSRYNHTQLSSDTAQELVDLANQTLQQHANFPDAEQFRNRIPYLVSISRRNLDQEESLVAKLRSSFKKPWISNLWMVKLDSGEQYYTKAKAVLSDDPIVPCQLEYIKNFDLETNKASIRSREVTAIEPAPQTILADRASEILRDTSDANFEKQFCTLLQHIYAAKQSHALVRLALLRQTLEHGCEGSLPLKQAFRHHLADISESPVNTFANWLDPNDPEAQAAHAQAEKILNDLSDLQAAAKAAAAEWRQLQVPVGTEYHWVGWLGRNDGGEWQAHLKETVIDNGDLAVVRRSSSENNVVVDVIGHMRQGSAQLAVSTKRSLLEGRPIFLLVPAWDKDTVRPN